MSELTDWLLEAIAADEHTARACVIPAHDGHRPHPELDRWFVGPSGEVEYVQTAEMLAYKYAEPWYVTMDHEGLLPSVEEPIATHIAAHDPGRVLALCAAHRRIVELMSDEVEYIVYGDEVLRALASAFAGRPGFKEEWAHE